MVLKKILTITILLLTTTFASLANENYGPGFTNEKVEQNQKIECTDDVCQKINELYKNETNLDLKKMETSALKAAVHPGTCYAYDDFELICNVNYDEKLKYSLSIIGLENEWPRYRIDGNILKIYGKKHNNEEANYYAKEIDSVYNFINEVKKETEGMNDYDKIFYLQNLLSTKLEYDFSDGYIYKINHVVKSNKAICAGYSNLFYLCCINIGIKCECVGNSSHMWNRVWLDNEWKYIDVTWNDTIGSNVWYLISESQLDKDHPLLDCFKNPQPVNIPISNY